MVGAVVVLVVISCFGWVMKFLHVVLKYTLGCLFKGLIYAFCTYIILMLLMMLL